MNFYSPPQHLDPDDARPIAWRLRRLLPVLVGAGVLVMGTFNVAAMGVFHLLAFPLPTPHLLWGNAALLAYLIVLVPVGLRVYRHRVDARGLHGFSAFGSRVYLPWEDIVAVRQRRLVTWRWVELRGPDTRRMWLPVGFLADDPAVRRACAPTTSGPPPTPPESV